MTPVVAVAAIVFDEAGRVLLVRRGRPPGEGLWTVPGGKLEPRERLADAVVREVREETGLEVECGSLVAVVERQGDTWHFVILDYRATLVGGTLRAADDASDARWVDAAELAALPTTEGLLDVIEQARVH
jgi:ADP-ribose pyrophosphatase YjhB (NUDIX family)